jgi:hypothetical protein
MTAPPHQSRPYALPNLTAARLATAGDRACMFRHLVVEPALTFGLVVVRGNLIETRRHELFEELRDGALARTSGFLEASLGRQRQPPRVNLGFSGHALQCNALLDRSQIRVRQSPPHPVAGAVLRP